LKVKVWLCLYHFWAFSAIIKGYFQIILVKKDYRKDLEYGSKVALRSIIMIATLAIVKGVLGSVTGFVVLIADALSSFADFLSLFAAYIGLRLSQRSATKNFKYGYYKAETFAALVAAVVIIYFGIDILLESVDRIVNPKEPEHLFLVFFSVGLSILFSLYASKNLIGAGKKINSLALINNGKDKKMDVLVEVAVLFGAGAHYLHFPYLEGVVGVVISFLTLKLGLETAKEALFFLLDYFDDQALMKKVRDIIESKAHIVRDIKDIRMRRAGTFVFGEAFLEINPYAQTKDIRNELKTLKEGIEDASPYLKDFLIFVDIPYRKKVKVAVPVKEDKGLESELAPNFAETNAYIFVEVKEKEIVDSYSHEFKFAETDIKGITDFLQREKVNIIVNNDMHSLMFYELRRLKNIDVYPTFGNVNNVENIVKLLLIDT